MVSTTAGGERGLDVGKQPVTRVLMSAGRAEHWPSLGNASTRAFSAAECSRRCVGGSRLTCATRAGIREAEQGRKGRSADDRRAGPRPLKSESAVAVAVLLVDATHSHGFRDARAASHALIPQPRLRPMVVLANGPHPGAGFGTSRGRLALPALTWASRQRPIAEPAAEHRRPVGNEPFPPVVWQRGVFGSTSIRSVVPRSWHAREEALPASCQLDGPLPAAVVARRWRSSTRRCRPGSRSRCLHSPWHRSNGTRRDDP